MSREGYVEVPGGKVWYQVAGETSLGIPLLCLHGGPGLTHDYLETLADLAPERPVIFYDQLGCGKSPVATDDPSLWVIERFLDELDSVRRGLSLSRVHLFGNSWGAMLAIQYVLDRRSDLISLTLSSPLTSSKLFIEGESALRAELPQDVQATIARHEQGGYFACPEYAGALSVFYKRHLCRLDPWPDAVERTFAGFGASVYNTMWGPSEFGPLVGNLKDWDVRDRVGEIKVKTLITGGRYDEVRPEHLAQLRAALPNSELLIFEDSSHMAFLEQRDRYIEAMRSFLHAADREASRAQTQS